MKPLNKWSIKDQANFLKQISELLERGYPLHEAIDSISFQYSEKFSTDFEYCLQQLKQGNQFSSILHELNFNSNLIGYVFFAEQHGGFIQALQEGADVVLKRQSDLNRLKKLLSYPLVLILFTCGAFIIVERVLLPRFLSLFASLQIEQNVFTKLLILFAQLLPTLLLLVLLVSCFMLAFYFTSYRHKSQLWQKSLLLKIPLLSELLRLFYTQYYATQLSYLLSGGLSINNALKVFVENTNQPFYKEISFVIEDGLRKGEEFTHLVGQLNVFEQDFANIVKHGQQNGRLDKELYFYSRHCLNRLENNINKLMKLIQPVLYLLIGMLIVAMYLAIMLPMFKILDSF